MKLKIETALDIKDKIIPQKIDDSKEEKLKSLIKDFAEVITLNNAIINRIDFEDKTFINRIYDNVENIIDEDLLELKESIKQIGLINIIYLIKKKSTTNKDLTIVSGLRRSLAVSKLIEDGQKINFPERVVIFETDVPLSVLDSISIDENLQRKNLTILEQSYKFNKEAKAKNKDLEEILEDNKISRKHFYRIKNAMSYPAELKEIIEDLGVTKAAILNSLIKLEGSDKKINTIIEEYKSLPREELEKIAKDIKKSQKNKLEKISYKTNKSNNRITIQIDISENEEFLKIYKEFKEKIEKL